MNFEIVEQSFAFFQSNRENPYICIVESEFRVIENPINYQELEDFQLSREIEEKFRGFQV